MNKETLIALCGSIRKWEQVRDEELEDKGIENCPLCKEFYTFFADINCCVGCPVFAKTGLKYCDDTPYRQYRNHIRFECEYEDDYEEDKRILAQAEVDFLKSLLPTEAQNVGE